MVERGGSRHDRSIRLPMRARCVALEMNLRYNGLVNNMLAEEAVMIITAILSKDDMSAKHIEGRTAAK